VCIGGRRAGEEDEAKMQSRVREVKMEEAVKPEEFEEGKGKWRA
jgi:hypothetical protein